ncbi:MAG: cation:proton antiporter [Geminicoccaceae bacterium]|nr:cation:proton antiporter [Geminicoccaceae bacterium]
MTILSFGLAALAGVLLLLALLDAVAARVRAPLPVLAAATGLASGLVAHGLGWSPMGAAFDSYDAWFFTSLALDPQSVIYVFLPPLLFEVTLGVDVRKLSRDAAVVVVMAVLAVLVATITVGGLLAFVSGLSIAACVLLGATVSTTDPAAVVSVFRRIGAPRRLLVVLEGESLLNDAAAIALFALIVDLLRTGAGLDPMSAGERFLYLFAVGGAIGVVVGWACARLLSVVPGDSLPQVSITLALAYAAFLVAELSFQASGVVAVVAAGLTLTVAGTGRVADEVWGSIRIVWAQLGYWSNGLIILIAAWMVPQLVAELTLADAPLVAAVVAGAFAARALVLFGLLPLLDALGLAAPINRRQKLLVWWGGIRGAVTLLLATSLTTTSALPEGIGDKLAAIGCAFVFFTLLVNAGTLALVTRLLGLDRLDAGDRALHGELVAGTMRAALAHVDELATAHGLAAPAYRRIRDDYEGRLERLVRTLPPASSSFGERLRTGLVILSNQERRIVRQHHDDAVIGRETMRALQRVAEGLADAAIEGGRPGYEARADASLGFTRSFRAAVQLQRFAGLDLLLSRMLARRFHLVFEWQIVLRDLERFTGGRLAGLIGEDAARNLCELVEERLEKVGQALAALELQYPSYAQNLQQAFVERAALRWERHRYDRLRREAIIGPELHKALTEQVERRIARTFTPPDLDAGFARGALIEAVPFFADLDAVDRKRIGRLVRTRLALPGEVVAAAGERGSAMYFVASGALEMRRGEHVTRLGTGDFFGELAVLRPTRRRESAVTAIAFSRLLVLHRLDLKRLMGRRPELEARLEAAYRESVRSTVRTASSETGATTLARRSSRHEEDASQASSG